jgi:hypothetical protein
MDMNQRVLQMVMKQDLFFHALPNKTLCLKGEKCYGSKVANFLWWFYDWGDGKSFGIRESH